MATTQPPKKLNPQVKIMLLLTLLFFGGIVAYTILPEGAVRGMALTLVSGGVVYVMFKGG